MTKRLAFAIIFSLLPTLLWAQDSEKSKDTKTKVQKPSRDFVMLQLTYNGWANAPDSIKLAGFSRGFNGYLCYDFPIGKSKFSFAAGVGISASNYYFKNKMLI